MKRMLLFLCGLCWFAAGIAAAIFGFCYILADGGNLPGIIRYFGLIYSGGVLLGMVHFIGFCLLAALCVAIGISLCSYSFEPRDDESRL